MPRPPPPQLALSMPGKPTARTRASAVTVSAGSASVAGTVGTPARAAMARAETLSPSRRSVSGRGPMKAIPASAQVSANSGDSGEEAVARMDGIALRLDRDADDVVHGEVGGDGAAPLADAVGLVCLEAMEGEVILFGEDRDRGLAHLVAARRTRMAISPRFATSIRSKPLIDPPARSPDRRVRAFYTDVYSCGSRWCGAPLPTPISRSTSSAASTKRAMVSARKAPMQPTRKLSSRASLPG